MINEQTLEQSRISYVDLPAIIGGAVLALAISLVLFNFGNAIGIVMPHEYHWDGANAWAGIIAIGLWGLWVQILASMTGGYLAGRMRRPIAGAAEHEREIRDGAHGLLVWALGTVAVAIGVGITAAIGALAVDHAAVVADKTPEMLNKEHNAAVISAFITSSTCLVSAVASWWAATKGGEHRDRNVDHSHYVSFNR